MYRNENDVRKMQKHTCERSCFKRRREEPIGLAEEKSWTPVTVAAAMHAMSPIVKVFPMMKDEIV